MFSLSFLLKLMFFKIKKSVQKVRMLNILKIKIRLKKYCVENKQKLLRFKAS